MASPIMWTNPVATLTEHTQLDAAADTGAAALVGGLVRSGCEAPQRLEQARTRLEVQLARVRRGLGSRMELEWNRDCNAYRGMIDVSEARRLLRSLPPNASDWGHRELRR